MNYMYLVHIGQTALQRAICQPRWPGYMYKTQHILQLQLNFFILNCLIAGVLLHKSMIKPIGLHQKC